MHVYTHKLSTRSLQKPSNLLYPLVYSLFLGPVMTYIRTLKVEAVDTTGAGDALIGALAFYMSCYPQLSFAEMVSRAVNIAAVTVTVRGVQSSYPARGELEDWLFDSNAKTSEQLGLEVLSDGNLRSGSIFVSLGETFRREGRNEK